MTLKAIGVSFGLLIFCGAQAFAETLPDATFGGYISNGHSTDAIITGPGAYAGSLATIIIGVQPSAFVNASTHGDIGNPGNPVSAFG